MPDPSLSERTIASIAALRRPRVVVISLRKEIAAALTDGLSLSEIWHQLQSEGSFSVGYDRFRRLVRRYVAQSSSFGRRSRPRAGKGAGPGSSPATEVTSPSSPARSANGFTYTPASDPKELF